MPHLTALAIVYVVKYLVKRKKRRLPLCSRLLRSSGDSLPGEIDDITRDLTFCAVLTH
jgi:hypothetical protein